MTKTELFDFIEEQRKTILFYDRLLSYLIALNRLSQKAYDKELKEMTECKDIEAFTQYLGERF